MSDILKQVGESVAHRAAESLQGAVLSFDLDGEIKRLREENGWQAGRNSKTLVKHPDFRVVLTVLKSGTRLQEHKAAGRISVQAVTGRIRMHVQGEVFDLPAGHLLALDQAVPHDVEALEDSAFLLTIAWSEDAART